MLKKQDAPTAIDVPVPPLIKPQVGDPLVGVWSPKSPGFAPLLLAEPVIQRQRCPTTIG